MDICPHCGKRESVCPCEPPEVYGGSPPAPTSAWLRREGETEDAYLARCRHYQFMAYDPDNPDIPLD
jgi:hypothetical protein